MTRNRILSTHISLILNKDNHRGTETQRITFVIPSGVEGRL